MATHHESNFAKLIKEWFRISARPLPWRRYKDPYAIWISEVMLQQTTVSAVVPYFRRWMKKFPTIGHVARASLTDIFRVWQGLGYYARAKNIHKASRIIFNEYGGRIPDDENILASLPGFGPYTTGAVLSLAYGRPVPIIDANIRRVIMRLLAIKGGPDRSSDKIVQDYLMKNIPRRGVRLFNEGLMELGALVCKKESPFCGVCPVKRMCRAYRAGIQETIPKPLKVSVKKIEAVVGILEQNGNVYIQKRPMKGLLAGLWEFPGGKLEKDESPAEALKRELKEELGVDIRDCRYFKTVKHAYTQFRVTLHAYFCRLAGTGCMRVDKTHKWVPRRKLPMYPMPSGSTRLVDHLMSCH